MNKLRAGLVGLLVGGLGLVATDAMAGWEVNMPVGVTPISHDVYHVHMTIFWICVAIGIGVFGVMFWSIVHHRKSRGVTAAQFHHSTTAEIIWTIIPFFILVGMAIPATKALVYMHDYSNPDLTIRVTGYQWKWKYDYVDQGVSFYSTLASSSRKAIYGLAPKDAHYLLEVDHPLVLPVHKKVLFLITGGDVIHSWWVPDLGMKKDAIPGYINEMWATIEKPGTYRGQCAELCGKDHAFMPIVVVAKSDADYQKWLQEQKKSGGSKQAAASGARMASLTPE